MMDGPSIHKLPNEILLMIFSYVSVEDLALNIQFVCRRWFQICSSDYVWKDSLLCASYPYSLKHVSSVLEKVPQLQCCEISSPTPEILQKLSKYCKNLRKLKLHCMFLSICKEEFINLMSCCTKLEELDVPGEVLASEEATEAIGQLNNLHTLFLINQTHRLVTLKHIAVGCLSLRHLYMGDMEWHYSDVKYFFEQKKNQLQSLGIAPRSVEGSCVISLLEKQRVGLSELRLEGNFCVYNPYTFSTVKNISNLTSLSLIFTDDLSADIISNAFVNRGMASLLKLEIVNSDEVTSDLMNCVCNNCPNLLKLGLESSFNLTDEGLRFLHKCPNLQHLDINECISLTETALDHVTKCTNLKFLDISRCDNFMTNLVRLLELSELRQLDFEGCNVVGLPLECFPYYLKKLQKVTFGPGHGIGDEIIASLREKMPHLRIEL